MTAQDDGLKRYETAKAERAQHAAEAFSQHEVSRTPEGDYVCRRLNGSSMYSFRVILRPGYVIVCGDIGDWILQHADRDSLGWLRRAARDPGYLLSKLRAGDEQEFYPGDVVDWLKLCVAEDTSGAAALLERALEAIAGDGLWRDRWAEMVLNAGWESDGMDVGSDHGTGNLWLAEAMKWFVAHVEQPAAAEGASP